MERVKKANASDFPNLDAEWWQQFPEDIDYEDGYPPNALNALRWMLGMWLVKDSEGFLKAASEESFQHSYWAAQAMVELMPEKAADLIFGAGRAGLNGFFVSSVARELAEKHPVLYLKMNPDGTINLIPDHGSNDDWVSAITNLAKMDAPAAGNACLRWGVENAPNSVSEALMAVASAWKPSDPPISEWANGIADPKLRNFANHAWLSALAEKDPRAALKELYRVKLEDGEGLDSNAPMEILEQLAKADPVEALKLLKDVERFFSKYKWDPFAENSAELQAEIAANPLKSLGSGDDILENNHARRAVLDGLAEIFPNDPVGLLAATRKLIAEVGGSDASWQLGIEAYLIRLKSGRWSVEESLTAARLWSEASNATKDDPTLQKLATRVAHADPEQALAALQQFPEQARPFLMGEIIKRLPASDSTGRIALLTQLPATQWDEELGGELGRNGATYASFIAALPAEANTFEVRRSFMKQWGEEDPEAAAQWLESLPDDATTKPAAAGLASAWSWYDPDAAAAWAEGLPAGPARDGALEIISSFRSTHDKARKEVELPRDQHSTEGDPFE